MYPRDRYARQRFTIILNRIDLTSFPAKQNPLWCFVCSPQLPTKARKRFVGVHDIITYLRNFKTFPVMFKEIVINALECVLAYGVCLAKVKPH